MDIAEFKSFKALYDQETFGLITLGRAFCNHFDIEDANLAAEEDPKRAEKMILNKYLDW